MTDFSAAAREANEQTETSKRPWLRHGERWYCPKEGAPQWIRELFWGYGGTPWTSDVLDSMLIDCANNNPPTDDALDEYGESDSLVGLIKWLRDDWSAAYVQRAWEPELTFQEVLIRAQRDELAWIAHGLLAALEARREEGE